MKDDELLRALGAVARQQAEVELGVEAAALFAPPSEAEVAKLTSLGLAAVRSEGPAPRPRRRGRVVAAALAVAAAAGIALWLFRARAELPRYALETLGGDQVLRSGAQVAVGRASVTPASVIELRLRPERQVDGPLETQLLIAADGEARPVALAPELAPSGAARVRTTVRAVVGSKRGELTVILVVARKGSLPAPASAASQPEGTHGAWASVRLFLLVRDR